MGQRAEAFPADAPAAVPAPRRNSAVTGDPDPTGQRAEAFLAGAPAVAPAPSRRGDDGAVFDSAVAARFGHVRRLKEIPYGATLAIYGPNVVGRALHRMIAEQRSDLTVFCFLDAFRDGELEGLPLLHPEDTARFIQQVDLVLVTQLDKLDRIAKNLALYPSNKVRISYACNFQLFGDFSKKTPPRWSEKVAFVRSKLDSEGQAVWDILTRGIHEDSLFALTRYLQESGKTELNYLEKAGALKDGVILDGGAYDGRNTVDFLASVGTRGRVIAFEPLGFAAFSETVKGAVERFGNVEVEAAGLWSQDGELAFHHSGAASSFVNHGGAPDAAADRVPVRSIDSYVAERGLERLDLIKLDVEGAEIEVLKGAAETIETLRPQLAVTIYHGADQYIEVPWHLVRQLERYRFTVDVFSPVGRDAMIYATPL